MDSRIVSSSWRILRHPLVWVAGVQCVAAPLWAAAVPFSGEQTIITGYSGAWAVETVDFDGDDDPDVMCSAESGIVSWAENTSGDGSTWTRHDLDPDFSRARGVAVGDFDGDGHPDGAAAAWNANEVDWYRNELDGGAPGFVQLAVDTTNFGANDVAGVDVDGDGDLDLFSAGRVSDRFFWHENRLDEGDGWVEHTIAAGINAANDVWYGDVDGDGDVDLVGGSGSGRGLFGWWENDIGGSSCPGDWCEHVVDSGSTLGVFAADLDYDGDIDLLRHEQGVRFAWWENTAGNGSAWTEHVLGSVSGNGFSIEAVDLDLDGDLDVLGTTDGDWFENLDGHAGSWTRRSYYDGTSIFDTKPEDVDGDGDVDLVATLRDAGHVSWWENLTCSPGDPDADSDGVPDHCDLCSGFDDKQDADEDGVPDGCDLCPGSNDHVDTDSNGVPDACEGGAEGGTLTIGDVTQAEGDSGTTGFAFTVTFVGTVSGGFTVGYSTSDGTATAPEDYTATSGTLTFSGMTGETQTIFVPVVGDSVAEQDETFRVSLGTPSSPGVTVTDGTGFGTIENDDAAMPSMLSIDDPTQSEGGTGTSGFVFTVTLSGEAPGGFTIDYATADGTASAPGDYAATSGTLTFTGTNGETRTLTVPVVGDGVVEPDETFFVNLGTPSSGSVTVSDGTGQGTIENDDSASVSIDAVTQVEGDSGTTGFVFTVTLSGEVSGGFTVSYSTADGTATAPGDYSSTSGTMTFAGSPGETQTITVPVVGDSVVEADETFTVTLGAPSNGSVTARAGTGQGTIENDDNASLSIDDVAQAEGDTGSADFVFTVTLTGQVQDGFMASYSTADGTATAPDDYAATSGVLTFSGADGESDTISVPVTGNVIVEPDETFTVELGAPSDPRVTLADGTGRGAILNDDGAALLTATKAVFTYSAAADRVTYRIQIGNVGEEPQVDDPTSDELEDVLPEGLRLLSVTSDSPAFLLTVDPDSNTVRGNGSIPVDGVVTIDVDVFVLADPGEEVTNQAVVRFDADHDGTNDTTAASDDPSTPEPGDATTFVVRAAGVDVPTLGDLGRLLLALLLVAVALPRLRAG